MSKKLQNILPYLFPLIAIVFVGVMFARWYKGKTAETPVSMLDSQLQVESLPSDVQNDIIKGATGYEMQEMQGASGAGELRYQIKDNKLTFTVTANLPESEEEYAVWLADLDGNSKKRVFNLVYSKAGYVGSAVVDASVLPVKVIVVKASDLMLQDILLQAELSAPEAK